MKIKITFTEVEKSTLRIVHAISKSTLPFIIKYLDLFFKTLSRTIFITQDFLSLCNSFI